MLHYFFITFLINISIYTDNLDTGTDNTETVAIDQIFVARNDSLAISCAGSTTIPACLSQEEIDLLFVEWLAQFAYTGTCSEEVDATDLTRFQSPGLCGDIWLVARLPSM